MRSDTSAPASCLFIATHTRRRKSHNPSPRPVEMLLLARSYEKADAAEPVALLATGEGILATGTGTAFDVYYMFNPRDAARHGGADVSHPSLHQAHCGVGIGDCSAHGRPVKRRDSRPRLRAGLTR